MELSKLLDDGASPSVETVTDQLAQKESSRSIRKKLIKLFTANDDSINSSTTVVGTSRVKLILICLFLSLHVLNLCTTLTSHTAFSRYISHPFPATVKPLTETPDSSIIAPMFINQQSPSLDTISPALEKILAHLSGSGSDITLVTVYIAPLIEIDVLPSLIHPPLLPAPSSFPSAPSSSLMFLDEFMSSWTAFVGDPVMSKWIVLALVMSVLLNAYLLKGIATGSLDERRRFEDQEARVRAAVELSGNSLAPAERAARILLASTAGGSIGLDQYSPQERQQLLSACKPRRWSISERSERGQRQIRRPTHTRFHSHAGARELLSEGPTCPEPEQDQSEGQSSPVVPALKQPSSANSTSHEDGELTSRIFTPSASDGVREAPYSQPAAVTPTLKAFGAAGEKPMIFTPGLNPLNIPSHPSPPAPEYDRLPNRAVEECEAMLRKDLATKLTDEEVVELVQKGKLAAYALEKSLKDFTRAVRIRRALICK